MPTLDIAHDAIPGFTLAGAVVRRPFSRSGEAVRAGAILSAEAFLSIGYAVRRIFVREGQITPFFEREGRVRGPMADAQRHLIHRGSGRYDVIAGVMLNEEPLSKTEAEELATVNGRPGSLVRQPPPNLPPGE